LSFPPYTMALNLLPKIPILYDESVPDFDPAIWLSQQAMPTSSDEEERAVQLVVLQENYKAEVEDHNSRVLEAKGKQMMRAIVAARLHARNERKLRLRSESEARKSAEAEGGDHAHAPRAEATSADEETPRVRHRMVIKYCPMTFPNQASARTSPFQRDTLFQDPNPFDGLPNNFDASEVSLVIKCRAIHLTLSKVALVGRA
jgi:hypothetical protein